MNETVFKLIISLIPVMGVVITGFIVPYIQTKISAEKMNTIMVWVTRAVQAAEKLFEHGDNEAKKQYVVDFVYKMFCSKKEVITKEQIEVLLEAAVLELKK